VPQSTENDNDPSTPVGAICWSIDELALATGISTSAQSIAGTDDRLSDEQKAEEQAKANEHVSGSIASILSALDKAQAQEASEPVKAFTETLRVDVAAVDGEIRSPEFVALAVPEQTNRIVAMLTHEHFDFDKYPGSADTMKLAGDPGSGCNLGN